MIVSKKVYFIVLFFVLSANFLKSMEEGALKKEFSLKNLSDFVYSNVSVEQISQVSSLNFNSKEVDLQDYSSDDSEKKAKKKHRQKTLKNDTSPFNIINSKKSLRVVCGVDRCKKKISVKGKDRFIQNFFSHVAINHFDTNMPEIKSMVEYPNYYCVVCPNCSMTLRNTRESAVKNSYKRHVLLMHESELKKDFREYINSKAEQLM
jgi:hypothetical protein